MHVRPDGLHSGRAAVSSSRGRIRHCTRIAVPRGRGSVASAATVACPRSHLPPPSARPPEAPRPRGHGCGRPVVSSTAVDLRLTPPPSEQPHPRRRRPPQPPSAVPSLPPDSLSVRPRPPVASAEAASSFRGDGPRSSRPPGVSSAATSPTAACAATVASAEAMSSAAAPRPVRGGGPRHSRRPARRLARGDVSRGAVPARSRPRGTTTPAIFARRLVRGGVVRRAAPATGDERRRGAARSRDAARHVVVAAARISPHELIRRHPRGPSARSRWPRRAQRHGPARARGEGEGGRRPAALSSYAPGRGSRRRRAGSRALA